jgi:hypothetical protein
MGWFEALFGSLIRKGDDWDGAERRNAFRARCNFDLEVQAPGVRYLAHVQDAGPQGLKMRVRGPYVSKVLKKGSPIRLRYVEPIYEAELDTVDASIRWVRREGEQLFTMAVAFEDSIENLKKSWVKPTLQKAFKTSSRRNQRKWMRAKCNLAATALHGDKVIDVKVNDLSTSGARIASLQPFAVGEATELHLEGMILRGIVRRVQAEFGVHRIGIAFAPDPVYRQQLLALVKKLVQVGKLLDT